MYGAPLPRERSSRRRTWKHTRSLTAQRHHEAAYDPIRTAGPTARGRIHLILFVPAKIDRPVPVFLGLNFRGNHMALADERIRLPTGWVPNGPGVTDHQATDAGRGLEVPHWPLRQAIKPRLCRGDLLSRRYEAR